MFDWLLKALGTMLYWFSEATGGYYILALLIYAFLFKVVFLPFAIKQQKNQIKMAKLTPKIELIKAKYRGRTDAVTMQKQQEEIMALQKSEGYSMMSGCLPLLIQLPIIMLIYSVIREPLTYICQVPSEGLDAIKEMLTNLGIENIPQDQISLASLMSDNGISAIGFGGIREVPNLSFFGIGNISMAATPSLTEPSALLAIPVLAAGFQWLSMFLTRKWNGNANQLATGDAQSGCSTKMLDYMMPLMTLFFTFSFSAVLGIYWVYQSIFTILQTFILSRVMPMPRYTEEEIKAFKKAQREQEKMQKGALRGQQKYKSLHYIDEDDYDDLPTIKTNPDPTSSATKFTGSEKPEIKD